MHIADFRNITANQLLRELDFGYFFRECVLKFWKQNTIPLGWIYQRMREIKKGD